MSPDDQSVGVLRGIEKVGDPGPHESALFDLQAKYAEVVDEDGVVSWLGKELS